jgi:6-phosphofructokinase/CheY-like chemotaxis protein
MGSFLPTFVKRVAAAFTALAFVFTTLFPQVAAASSERIPTHPFGFDLPWELGKVEAFRFPKEGSPIIFHLQTAHGDVETQRRVKKILRHLQDSLGIKLIFAEGASERLDPELLRFFPGHPENLKLADLLLEKGLFTGIDLFLIDQQFESSPGLNLGYSSVRKNGATKPNAIEVLGIEDAQFYRGAYEAFQEVLQNQSATGPKLDLLEGELDREASKTLSKELFAFIKNWLKFEEGRSQFLSYANFLREEAKQDLKLDFANPFLQIEWPQLVRLTKLQEFEKDLDLETLEKEKKTLASKFPSISPPNLKQTSRRDFEQALEEALSRGFRFEAYPNFTRWTAREILRQELDARPLFSELERLWELLKAAKTKRKDEQEFLRRYEELLLIKKLFRLELTREEWKKVKNQPLRLTRSDSTARLARRFYRLAERRESIFTDRIKRELASRKEKRAILVTGGFHTSGLTRIFKEKDFGYVLISPRMEGEVHSSLYRKIMLDLAQIEKIQFAQRPQTKRQMGLNPRAENNVVREAYREVLKNFDPKEVSVLWRKTAYARAHRQRTFDSVPEPVSPSRSEIRTEGGGTSRRRDRIRVADQGVWIGKKFTPWEKIILFGGGGGDAPGINTAYAELIRLASRQGFLLLGVRQGLYGLKHKGEFQDILIYTSPEEAGETIQYTGSALMGSERYDPFTARKTEEDEAKRLEDLDRIVSRVQKAKAVVLFGGDDHYKLGIQLRRELRKRKINTLIQMIPKTIDGDIGATQSLGYHTAWTEARREFLAASLSARTHNRINVVEIMGRDSGRLAFMAGRKFPVDLEEVRKTIVPRIAKKLGEVSNLFKFTNRRLQQFLAKRLGETVDLTEDVGDILDQFKWASIHRLVRDETLILVPERPTSLQSIVDQTDDLFSRYKTAHLLVSEGFVVSKNDLLLKKIFDFETEKKTLEIVVNRREKKTGRMVASARFTFAEGDPFSKLVLALLGRRWNELPLKEIVGFQYEQQDSVAKDLLSLLGQRDEEQVENLTPQEGETSEFFVTKDNERPYRHLKEKFEAPAKRDVHGNPILGGISEYVWAAIVVASRHARGKESLVIRGPEIGRTLRGYIPDRYDRQLGKLFAKKAIELIQNGDNDHVVTFPWGAEPGEDEVRTPHENEYLPPGYAKVPKRTLNDIPAHELKRQGVFFESLRPLEQLLETGTTITLAGEESIAPEDIDRAIGEGRTGVSLDPRSVGNLLRLGALDGSLKEIVQKKPAATPEEILESLTEYLLREGPQGILGKLGRAYKESEGATGYVSVEIDPTREDWTKPSYRALLPEGAFEKLKILRQEYQAAEAADPEKAHDLLEQMELASGPAAREQARKLALAQAIRAAGWGPNVVVKIQGTNLGFEILRDLTALGINTALELVFHQDTVEKSDQAFREGIQIGLGKKPEDLRRIVRLVQGLAEEQLIDPQTLEILNLPLRGNNVHVLLEKISIRDEREKILYRRKGLRNRATGSVYRPYRLVSHVNFVVGRQDKEIQEHPERYPSLAGIEGDPYPLIGTLSALETAHFLDQRRKGDLGREGYGQTIRFSSLKPLVSKMPEFAYLLMLAGGERMNIRKDLANAFNARTDLTIKPVLVGPVESALKAVVKDEAMIGRQREAFKAYRESADDDRMRKVLTVGLYRDYVRSQEEALREIETKLASFPPPPPAVEVPIIEVELPLTEGSEMIKALTKSVPPILYSKGIQPLPGAVYLGQSDEEFINATLEGKFVGANRLFTSWTPDLREALREVITQENAPIPGRFGVIFELKKETAEKYRVTRETAYSTSQRIPVGETYRAWLVLGETAQEIEKETVRLALAKFSSRKEPGEGAAPRAELRNLSLNVGDILVSKTGTKRVVVFPVKETEKEFAARPEFKDRDTVIVVTKRAKNPGEKSERPPAIQRVSFAELEWYGQKGHFQEVVAAKRVTPATQVLDENTLQEVRALLIQARDLGLDPTLSKGETVEELRTRVETARHKSSRSELRNRAEVRSEGAKFPVSPSKVKILLAEDDSTTRILLRQMLGSLGYQVILSKDGKEALEKFKTQSPDLLITDGMMPEMGGRELITEVRKLRPGFTILLLSSGIETEPGKRTSAERVSDELGVAWMDKPIEPSRLAKKVESLVAISFLRNHPDRDFLTYISQSFFAGGPVPTIPARFNPDFERGFGTTEPSKIDSLLRGLGEEAKNAVSSRLRELHQEQVRSASASPRAEARAEVIQSEFVGSGGSRVARKILLRFNFPQRWLLLSLNEDTARRIEEGGRIGGLRLTYTVYPVREASDAELGRVTIPLIDNEGRPGEPQVNYRGGGLREWFNEVAVKGPFTSANPELWIPEMPGDKDNAEKRLREAAALAQEAYEKELARLGGEASVWSVGPLARAFEKLLVKAVEVKRLSALPENPEAWRDFIDDFHSWRFFNEAARRSEVRREERGVKIKSGVSGEAAFLLPERWRGSLQGWFRKPLTFLNWGPFLLAPSSQPKSKTDNAHKENTSEGKDRQVKTLGADHASEHKTRQDNTGRVHKDLFTQVDLPVIQQSETPLTKILNLTNPSGSVKTKHQINIDGNKISVLARRLTNRRSEVRGVDGHPIDFGLDTPIDLTDHKEQVKFLRYFSAGFLRAYAEHVEDSIIPTPAFNFERLKSRDISLFDFDEDREVHLDPSSDWSRWIEAMSLLLFEERLSQSALADRLQETLNDARIQYFIKRAPHVFDSIQLQALRKPSFQFGQFLSSYRLTQREIKEIQQKAEKPTDAVDTEWDFELLTRVLNMALGNYPARSEVRSKKGTEGSRAEAFQKYWESLLDFRAIEREAVNYFKEYPGTTNGTGGSLARQKQTARRTLDARRNEFVKVLVKAKSLRIIESALREIILLKIKQESSGQALEVSAWQAEKGRLEAVLRSLLPKAPKIEAKPPAPKRDTTRQLIRTDTPPEERPAATSSNGRYVRDLIKRFQRNLPRPRSEVRNSTSFKVAVASGGIFDPAFRREEILGMLRALRSELRGAEQARVPVYLRGVLRTLRQGGFLSAVQAQEAGAEIVLYDHFPSESEISALALSLAVNPKTKAEVLILRNQELTPEERGRLKAVEERLKEIQDANGNSIEVGFSYAKDPVSASKRINEVRSRLVNWLTRHGQRGESLENRIVVTRAENLDGRLEDLFGRMKQVLHGRVESAHYPLLLLAAGSLTQREYEKLLELYRQVLQPAGRSVYRWDESKVPEAWFSAYLFAQAEIEQILAQAA